MRLIGSRQGLLRNGNGPSGRLPAAIRVHLRCSAADASGSGYGSDNRLGGWYAYRASKAALNQLVRTASIELARRNPEALCVALHPGMVATPLSAPFVGDDEKAQSPATAAGRLLAVMDALPASASGGFFDAEGRTVPW